MEGPEGELHDHDYRIEVVASRTELDDQGMVVDLDLLDGALAHVASIVRDENLEKIRPAEADAVTVEVFARWVHGAISERLPADGEELAIRVWESPTAFGGYRASTSS